ncbi:MAG: 1,4-alpha-glucan branching protein GlgB [Verrucomicrobiales bacterium]
MSLKSPTLTPDQIASVVEARCHDPFSILGLHAHHAGWCIRTFQPYAEKVNFLQLESAPNGKVLDSFPAEKIHPAGLFEASVPDPISYQIEVHEGADIRKVWDAYSLPSQIGELDMYLMGEGRHWRLWDKLGAHLMTIDGINGVHFAVWAPNAHRVSVVGDFNQWDGHRHPMRNHPGAGVWEIFIPHVHEGAHYKFELINASGDISLKSDPFAFYGQHGLQTASMVFHLDRYTWSDDSWMAERREGEMHRKPLSIYEVHLGSWKRVPEEGNRSLSYRELADQLIPYVLDMGFTHIELMPVAEHPFDGSWGYQVTGFFAPTSRFGDPDEFREFVDRCHQAGIGVIVDWVPAHFPSDAHGLASFDGTSLYEHSDPRQGFHSDWGTLIFNFGRNEVRNFLIANALFWLEQYHIDGLRVDAVASMLYLDYSRREGEWVPNAFGGRENLDAIFFLKQLNEICYEQFPGTMTIAEESTSWPLVSRPTYLGGLGFGYKWNMGWMNDSLFYMSRDPIHRKYHQGTVTFSLLYAFHENFILVLSHDEVVHGKGSLLEKMPGDMWQKFANLRMFYGWMFGHPGKKLLFMGAEIGQWQEWRYDQSLDWHLLEGQSHSGLQRLVKDLNHLLKTESPMHEVDDSYEGFEWIDFQDSEGSSLSFVRKSSQGEMLLFVVNATPVVRHNYRIGAPQGGFYREVLNTDAGIYGGSNQGNLGGVWADPVECHGRPWSLNLTLPPLSTIALKYEELQTNT